VTAEVQPETATHAFPRLHEHLGLRRERALFAAVAFALTIAITRTTTGVLHAEGAGSNGGVIVGGVHIHHFVFGIVLVLVTSLTWLLLAGIEPGGRRWWFRFTAFVYGVGTALVLDEFALWLNLKDVYWQKQGHQSVEALALFGGLLALGVLIRPYGGAVWTHRRTRRGS
jgi:hypothetical protein